MWTCDVLAQGILAAFCSVVVCAYERMPSLTEWCVEMRMCCFLVCVAQLLVRLWAFAGPERHAVLPVCAVGLLEF